METKGYIAVRHNNKSGNVYPYKTEQERKSLILKYAKQPHREFNIYELNEANNWVGGGTISSGYLAVKSNNGHPGAVFRFLSPNALSNLKKNVPDTHKIFSLDSKEDALKWAGAQGVVGELNNEKPNPITNTEKANEPQAKNKVQTQSETKNKSLPAVNVDNISQSFTAFVEVIRDYILPGMMPALLELSVGGHHSAYLTVYPLMADLGIVRNDRWIRCRDINDNPIAVNFANVSNVALAKDLL